MDETYLDIKRKDGKTVFRTPINEGSKLKYTLMKEHYVTLKFSVDEPIFFKLGDGIECDFGLFELVDLYKPSLNKTNGAFDYELKLDAYYWKWKNKMFKYTPEHYGKEVSWSLTAPLYVHLNVFLRNLVSLSYDYKGVLFTYAIDSSVSSKPISVDYNNTSMIDALTAMANAITNLHEGDTCEWWVKDNVIHFGKCEFGTPIDFDIDNNVDHMTPSENKDSYASRFIVFGSTKNIPLRYRKNLIFTATSVNGQVMVDVNRPLKPSYFPTESIINSSMDNSFDVSNSKSGVYQIFDEYITDTNTFLKSLKAGTYTYDLSNISVELSCINGNNLSTVQTCTIYLKYGNITKILGVAQTSLSGKSATLNFSANGTFELDVDKDVSIIVETKTGINIRITENPQMEFVYTGTLSIARAISKSAKAAVTFLSGTNKGTTVSCVFNASFLDVANCNITLPKGTTASIGDTFSIDNIILINVPSSYFTKEDEDLTYNGVVQSRLMMPKDTPCIDIEEGLSQEEYVEEVLVNEEIFPNFSGTVTENPTVGIVNYKDERGNNTEETYPIYNITDSTLKNFKQSYISDKLHIIFQTGALAGLDFELNLRGSDDKGTTFEIVMNSNYGRDLPDLTMKPEKDNTYILYGYDPQFISDALIPQAEAELKAWAIKQKNLKKIDPSTYDCSMMSDVSTPIYEIGQKVNLINKGYFETSRQSRIIGYELNLDFAYDCPLYTVGESVAYSRLSAMEEKINELKYNGNTYYASSVFQGSTSGVYIINSNDNTEMSNSNVLSSLRVLKEISDRAISKTGDDSVQGHITFNKGITVSDCEILGGLTAKGDSSLQGALTVKGKTILQDALTAVSAELSGLMKAATVAVLGLMTAANVNVDAATIASINATNINSSTQVVSPIFIGALQGNASTATKLRTTRSILGIPFDGSSDCNGNAYTTGGFGVGTSNMYGSILAIGVSASTGVTTDAISFVSGSGSLSKIQSYNAGSYYQDLLFQTSNGISTPNLVTTLAIKGQTGNVGIGNTSPSYRLDVAGTFRATSDMFAGGNIGTSNYISQTQGWRVTNTGLADFRKIYADELSVQAFTAQVSQALAGSDYLTKSV